MIDPGGHRTSVTIDGVTTTYTRNAAGAVTQKAKSGQTVTYTQNQWGQTTQRVTTGTGAKTETFGVNYLGRTSSYTNSLTGANKSFPMWPSGEMFARTDNVAATNVIFATLDGETITEYDQAGAGAATLKNTFSGLGLNGKTTRIPASGGRAHFVGDHVNTLAMTLSDTGAPTETVVKGAYGEAITGSTAESYSGIAQAMRVDGLDYMHHRMYDPEDGEFLANDPIVENRAGPSYGYAGGDPLRLIDPLGLQDGWWDSIEKAFKSGISVGVGALEAIARGTCDFIYYGSGHVAYLTIDRSLGTEYFRSQAEESERMGQALVGFYSELIKDPVATLNQVNQDLVNARDRAVLQLANDNSYKGMSDLGKETINKYLLLRPMRRPAQWALEQNAGRWNGVPNKSLQQVARERAFEISKTQSGNARGAVLTVVADELFQEPIFRQNARAVPTKLHPFTAERLRAYLGDIAAGNCVPEARWATPGTHSEFLAFNDALLRRAAAGIPVTSGTLSQLTMYNVSLWANRVGTAVSRCGNCRTLTEGVKVLSDK